jgi:hypothetical protein
MEVQLVASISGRHLVGWKEICGFIRVSKKTAQRWTVEKGLPVHHPAGPRAAAVALDIDLLNWLIRNTTATAAEVGKPILKRRQNAG